VGPRTYLIINIVLAGMIMLIFIYSGLFSAGKANHPVPSFYEKITGEPAPSSGLSKAFSELVRGRIEPARAYNEDSPLIFAFFLIQLIQRIAIFLILWRVTFKQKSILIADLIFSTILFLYCFKGQIFKMTILIPG
jgi:hypothetical protein